VLLKFPQDVAPELLRDLTKEELAQLRTCQHRSELPSLYFTAYRQSDLPSTLKPVLGGLDGPVLLRTHAYVPQRIVLCTLPLDWQGHRLNQDGATTALLANALRYVCLGEPRRLVWRDPTGTANELIRRWLYADGRTAMRLAPGQDERIPDVDRWLLSNVDVLFVSAKHANQLRQREQVDRFLLNGGTVLSVAANSGDPTNEITATVGRHEERVMTDQLYAELRAVTGWDTLESAFALRNIVAALSFLWDDEINKQSRLAIPPNSKAGSLCEAIVERLGDPRHQEDFGSSLALAQTLAFLRYPETVDPEVVQWMRADGASREYDVGLQTEAVLAQVSATPPVTFLHDIIVKCGPRPVTWTSLAPVARILDAVALLAQTRLAMGEEEDVAEVAGIVCDAIDQFDPVPQRGWMSAEVTADILRGLIALHVRLTPGTTVRSRVATHVATGAAALRRARLRYDTGTNGVAWLARVTHALILAEREFPIGLQRLASVEWPEVETVSTSKADRSLLEQLAMENERLRVDGEKLSDQLRHSETRLEEEKIAAKIGRATATLTPTLILVTCSALLIRQIGWSSVPALLANITVLLSVSLTLLGWMFSFLNRRYLLASPARRIRERIENEALPVLKSAKDFKAKE